MNTDESIGEKEYVYSYAYFSEDGTSEEVKNLDTFLLFGSKNSIPVAEYKGIPPKEHYKMEKCCAQANRKR